MCALVWRVNAPNVQKKGATQEGAKKKNRHLLPPQPIPRSSLPSPQVIALTFCLLAVVTAKNVDWLRSAPLPPAGTSTAPARVWNAALAALILCILALSLFAAWSAAILGRTVIKKEKMVSRF